MGEQARAEMDFPAPKFNGLKKFMAEYPYTKDFCPPPAEIEQKAKNPNAEIHVHLAWCHLCAAEADFLSVKEHA